MFKKGEYIVILKGLESIGFKLNFCYKQRCDDNYLKVYKDINGSTNNGFQAHLYNKSFSSVKGLNDWRYATPQEILEYDKLNKPFNVIEITTTYEIY